MILDPERAERERQALLRRHRQVLLFNEREVEAIDAYCRSLGIRSKASALRRIIMERVIAQLDENHPTLLRSAAGRAGNDRKLGTIRKVRKLGNDRKPGRPWKK